MWTIRQEQMEVFEQAAWRQFEQEMAAHGKEFSPRLCRAIGNEQLNAAIRDAIRQADKYGFNWRGPIRLFIELTFLWGSAFDTDPQYSAVGKILRAPGDQMVRAQQIHEEHMGYFQKAPGMRFADTVVALRQLLSAFGQRPRFPEDNLATELVSEIKRRFPQKADYVSDAGLQTLVDEGFAEAWEYGFSTDRQHALMVLLMFLFGHGCTHDRLHPWIAQSLQDPRTITLAARAEQVEKQAATWVEQVFPGPTKD